jgi:subtilisin family serine protease
VRRAFDHAASDRNTAQSLNSVNLALEHPDGAPERNHLRKLFIVLSLAYLLATAGFADASTVARSKSSGIPNEYIVALTPDTAPNSVAGIARSVASTYDLEIIWLWPDTLRGFMCRGADVNIDRMSDDPRVRYVEQNVLYTMDAGGGVSGTQDTWFGNYYQWHLDRIDELLRSGADSKYNMCTEARNVTAYVIDQSIKKDHQEFETPTRVTATWDFTEDRQNPNLMPDVDTTNGCTARIDNTNEWHGTAVASVLGGTNIGAAKPNIVGLKVQPCGRSTIAAADLQNAIAWLNSHAVPLSVVNASNFVAPWDASFSAYGDAVAAFVSQRHIPFFVSANNYSGDACRFSPADRAYTKIFRNGSVFVAGATSIVEGDNLDHLWASYTNGVRNLGVESGSNAGSCVSIYAPGTAIFAASTSSRYWTWTPPLNGESVGPYNIYSGTSFASPLVAGVAVRYIAKTYNQTGTIPSHTAVYDWLLAQAQTQVTGFPTPQYWFCKSTTLDPDLKWTSSPPTVCPASYLGQAPTNAPIYFAARWNDSDARMLFWDEAAGLTQDGACP